MAVLDLYQRGVRRTREMNERIGRISALDRFAHGLWQGGSLEEGAIDWELRGLGALVANFRCPLVDRVALMADWLCSDDVEGLGEAVSTALREWRAALAESQVEARDGIAIVISRHRFAMEIGYTYAPVVVASNPAMRVEGGEPHLKHTVAVWPGSRALDLADVRNELNKVEPGCFWSIGLDDEPIQGTRATAREVLGTVHPFLRVGWGGNVAGGIIGSPQGVASGLTTGQVVEIVRRHLR